MVSRVRQSPVGVGRLIASLSVCAVILSTGAPVTAQEGANNPDLSLCALSQQALRNASAVRQLTPRTDVPCIVQDKAAVTRFIEETIREDLPPRKLAQEELAYKAIGMIPDSFDYQHALVEFLVSQIGGYYNPKKKLFVMAGWLPAAVQGGVAVHELTHALQDQYYDLRSVMNVARATTDTGLAVSALVEGDASAVMFDYERRNAGQVSLRELSSVDSIVLLQVLGLGIGAEVPESIKALLIFPYTSGLRFTHALLTRGGYPEVDRAYARVPSTTREILHPQEYVTRSFVPSIPEANELAGAPAGVVAEYTDVLGEFGISALFRGVAQTKDRGTAAAAGWLGDRVGVFPAQQGVRVISWLTRWESESDAREFAVLYREYLGGLHNTTMGEGETALGVHRRAIITQRDAEVSLVVRARDALP